MIRPDALKKNERLVWSAGTGTDVWDLFCACIAGDLETVTRLVGSDQRVAGELDGEMADPALCPEYTYALAFT